MWIFVNVYMYKEVMKSPTRKQYIRFVVTWKLFRYLKNYRLS